MQLKHRICIVLCFFWLIHFSETNAFQVQYQDMEFLGAWATGFIDYVRVDDKVVPVPSVRVEHAFLISGKRTGFEKRMTLCQFDPRAYCINQPPLEWFEYDEDSHEFVGKYFGADGKIHSSVSTPDDFDAKAAFAELSATTLANEKIKKWFGPTDADASLALLDKYSPGDQVVSLILTQPYPAFPFDGNVDQGETQTPRAFAKVEYTAISKNPAASDYFAKVFWFPGKNNTSGNFRNPIVVGDAFDPMNTRHAWEIFNDEKYRLLLSMDAGTPRAKGYDVLFLDFSQGGGDLLVNASIELKFIEWLHQNTTSDQGIVVAGPSMSGILGRIALLYSLPQNNTTNTDLAPRVAGYLSIDSPHQGASVSPYMQMAVKTVADETEKPDAIDSWNQLNVPAAHQMIYSHAFPFGSTIYDYSNPLEFPRFADDWIFDISSHNYDSFYDRMSGFFARKGNYRLNLPSAAVASSNFYVPHSGDPGFRRDLRYYAARIHTLLISAPVYAGGSHAPHEFAPGSTGSWYLSPFSLQTEKFTMGLLGWDIKVGEILVGTFGNERFKGTFIPIYSALDLDPDFDVYNPPTQDEAELARYTPFDEVYFLKDLCNLYQGRACDTGNPNRDYLRYEHIIFDNQVIAAIGRALDFLTASSINWTLSGKKLTQSGIYKARETIRIQDLIIKKDLNVSMKAGQEVRITPEFHAERGTSIHLSIDTGLNPVP